MDAQLATGDSEFVVEVHHRTTQLNRWVVAVVVSFFIIGGTAQVRPGHRQGLSTQSVQQALNTDADHWAASLC